MIVGYARVSTSEQSTGNQIAPLREAGCAVVYQDVASGMDRSRPDLARCLAALKPGDTLVIVRLDRLGRSLQHLLEIVTSLRSRDVHFRSLSDGFDTSTAQGRLMMHMLGAFAEFERELIRERVMAGLEAAKARGSKAGNPRLRARDRIAIAELRALRSDAYLRKARETSRPWIGLVERHRPHMPWDRLHERILRSHPDAPRTIDTLRRLVRRLVQAGDLPQSLLERTQVPTLEDAASAVAAVKASHPDAPNREIARVLNERGAHPPRGSSWTAESVRRALAAVDRLPAAPPSS